jgi:N-methylhydantoinase B
VRGDGIFFTCAYTRAVQRPWALDGGEEGSPNYVEILRAAGGCERYGVATALQLGTGDLIRIHTGNGGGYGSPSRRSRKRVLEDLRDELVSLEEAVSTYGLAPETVKPEGGEKR